MWRYVGLRPQQSEHKDAVGNAPIELRNLTEQLTSKIEKSTFADENKSAVLIPLESLLGINGDSREWRYLNKGTNEDKNRAEFAREAVKEIITHLESIDSALADYTL